MHVAVEAALLLRCLPCKYEEQSSDPQNPWKKARDGGICLKSQQEAETGGSLPLLASLAESVSFKLVRDPVAKSKVN